MPKLNKEYYTVAELAKLLGISRIAVFKKIKKGQVKAKKIGRNYAIPKKEVIGVTSTKLTVQQKKEIDQGVEQVVKEYGETLKLLAQE